MPGEKLAKMQRSKAFSTWKVDLTRFERSSASTFAGTRFGLLIYVQRVFNISNLLFRSLTNMTERESSTASCVNCHRARDSHWSAFSSTRRPVPSLKRKDLFTLLFEVRLLLTVAVEARSQSDVHIPASHSCLRCFSPSSLSSLQITGTRSPW